MKFTKPCALAIACVGVLSAQGAPDDNKVLTTFQNPVGDLISVPFQNNTNFPIGLAARHLTRFVKSARGTPPQVADPTGLVI